MRDRDVPKKFTNHSLRVAHEALEGAPRLLPNWKFQVHTEPRGEVSLLVWLPWQSPDTSDWTLRFGPARTPHGVWQGYTSEGKRVGRSCVTLMAALRSVVVGLVNDHKRRGKRPSGGGH